VLTAVVTGSGESLEVSFLGESHFVEALVSAEQEVPENDLNPLAVEMKELAWGFGSFAVMALILRYVLFPKLKKGMDARAEAVRRDNETAVSTTAAARTDVADYEAQVASLRAEAQQRVEAARATLEAERAERLAAANAEIADRRAAAMAEVDAARAAAQGDVEAAVVDVVSTFAERATGRPVDGSIVQNVVRDSMSAEVAR
jgi:F-type H+-transporting ATPase subunit b